MQFALPCLVLSCLVLPCLVLSISFCLSLLILLGLLKGQEKDELFVELAHPAWSDIHLLDCLCVVFSLPSSHLRPVLSSFLCHAFFLLVLSVPKAFASDISNVLPLYHLFIFDCPPYPLLFHFNPLPLTTTPQRNVLLRLVYPKPRRANAFRSCPVSAHATTRGKTQASSGRSVFPWTEIQNRSTPPFMLLLLLLPSCRCEP